MRRVLMIAYHFPPLAGSSGIQRTLQFVRHLPALGWQPTVLTAHPRAYERTGGDLLDDVPDGTRVIRAQAWDTARHFALMHRYPRFLALPDRWISWWLGAVPEGLAEIRRHRPDALWSTYPVATAHCIARTLSRRSGIPWVADFRDPMAQEGYPSEPAQWRSFQRVERATVEQARFMTFTAPGAVTLYRQRYPGRSERIQLIENGWEEAPALACDRPGPLAPGKRTLLHSGIVYPSERDPTRLMEALAALKARHPAVYARLSLRFRAPVHAELLHTLATRFEVESAVEILPPMGYRDAQAEMHAADGLLLLQAANCNEQIPAKFYEYLAARRPLLALTDPAGDTAKAVLAAGIDAMAPLDRTEAIAELLLRFMAEPTLGTMADEATIAGASRRSRATQLAELLDLAVSTTPTIET